MAADGRSYQLCNSVVAVFFLTLAFLSHVSIEPAHAHGGGLDRFGCHRDRKRDGYHCHGAGSPETPMLGRRRRGNVPKETNRSSSGEAAQAVPYSRELYGGWIDQDGDCQNTRHEVLIAESTRPVKLDAAGCEVVSGRWEDPYTGRVFTDPKYLDIDHFIPLAEAHRSGGAGWTPAQRREYANDLSNPDTLIAVSSSSNRSKGSKDPVRWLPPNRAYHCDYLKTWAALKLYWGLRADAEEKKFLDSNQCFKPEPGAK